MAAADPSDLAEARATAMTRAVTVTLAVLLVLSAAVLWRMGGAASRNASRRDRPWSASRPTWKRASPSAPKRWWRPTVRWKAKVLALKDAEQILTRTRDAAVQAGKLAVLGQMSAGITHEINQPLAALTTLADNGARLVELGRDQEARENPDMIRDLCSAWVASWHSSRPLQGVARARPKRSRWPPRSAMSCACWRPAGCAQISVQVEHRVPGLAARRSDPLRAGAAEPGHERSRRNGGAELGELSIVSEARDGHARGDVAR